MGILPIVLVIAGVGALVWGLVSILRKREQPLHPSQSDAGGMENPPVPVAPGPARGSGRLTRIKEIIAIIGGIISILTGILSIIEKFRN